MPGGSYYSWPVSYWNLNPRTRPMLLYCITILCSGSTKFMKFKLCNIRFPLLLISTPLTTRDTCHTLWVPVGLTNVFATWKRESFVMMVCRAWKSLLWNRRQIWSVSVSGVLIKPKFISEYAPYEHNIKWNNNLHSTDLFQLNNVLLPMANTISHFCAMKNFVTWG